MRTETCKLRRLEDLTADLIDSLIIGYTTPAIYAVSKEETPEHINFDLRLVPLEQPLSKGYPALTDETLEDYRATARQGHTFGAFVEDTCVGLALCEAHTWNASLWVQEFHISQAYQGQGIGRLLMERVIQHAQEVGLRCVVCETQTTNVPAIGFYRALGFVLDGIDLSYYTNHDMERQEIAVFLKKKLGPQGQTR
ncbi:MAG TPA: GNAT family N-acetyltransferase [Ktedonobacterales bacterium]|nr:GNAT family N-acetyltransferase [Ktedonobacterales bacterium]